jgi:ribosomal protein S27AE
MEIRVDALRQRPADVGAAFRASSLGAPGSQAGTRRELRCPDCGFGAVVAHPLRRCRMCGGNDWQLIESLVGTDDARPWRL